MQEGECLHQHLGCLVAAEPVGEIQPRGREPEQWPGGQTLDRRAPLAESPTPMPAATPGSRARERKRCRPAVPHPEPAGCGRLPARTSGCARWPPAAHGRWDGPCGGHPRPHHVGVHQVGVGEPGAKPAGEGGRGRPLQAVGAYELADPIGVGGQAVAGGKLKPCRARGTGEQGRRDAVPAQRHRKPQRRTAALRRVPACPIRAQPSSERPRNSGHAEIDDSEIQRTDLTR